MEYQDFTIDLFSIPGGRFQAQVADVPGRDSIAVDFDRPLEQQVFEALYGSRDKPAGGASNASPQSREVGQRLYSSIFQQDLESYFRVCRTACESEDAGLRLRLRFRLDDREAEYLAALPWEWFWDGRGFLSRNPDMAVVRDFLWEEAGRPGAPRNASIVGGPLRILVIASAPFNKKPLKLNREKRRIDKAFESLKKAGQVELRFLERNTLRELRKVLLDETFHILHFMGHGGYHSTTGLGALFFEKANGREDQVGGVAFAEHLAGIRSLRLVVLNACYTARHAGRAGAPLYSGVATAILERTGIPAVLAHQQAISDPAAIAFSETFYDRLAAGASVDAAVTEARLQLRPQNREWTAPVLFLSAPHGQLFSFATAEETRRGRSMDLEETVQPKDRPVRLGIQSFEGWERDEDVPVLNFLDSFADRYILKQELWQGKIFPELEMFLLKLGDPRRPLTLDLAAHASIAFAAGWILEEKSGHDVRIPQRTGGEGEREWSRKEGRVPKGPLWLDLPDIELSSDASDVALALAVTHPTVPEEAEEYIRRKDLPVRRIINATIAPKAGQDSVKSGAHSLALAQDLLPRLRQRYPPERGGRLHLFCAAPNALLFYLGQISRSLGRMVLYEYALDHDDPYARYCPSIELPPPGKARKLPEGW